MNFCMRVICENGLNTVNEGTERGNRMEWVLYGSYGFLWQATMGDRPYQTRSVITRNTAINQ